MNAAIVAELGFRTISNRSNMDRPIFLIIVSVFLVSVSMIRAGTSPVGYRFRAAHVMGITLAARRVIGGMLWCC